MGQENANSLEDVLLFQLHPRKKAAALGGIWLWRTCRDSGAKLSWPEPPHPAPCSSCLLRAPLLPVHRKGEVQVTAFP